MSSLPQEARRASFRCVVVQVSPDVPLTTIDGKRLTLEQWGTTFHLAIVALDPYTHESAWILPTAARILHEFVPSDCRTTLLVTCDEKGARRFLGPLVDEFLVFIDPDREAVKGFELERLPAILHINQAQQIEGVAQGWDPPGWQGVVDNLSKRMSWQAPLVLQRGDPTPYEGTAALT